MLTTPFEPYGHDYVALYLFDTDGNFLEARIDDVGQRPQSDLSAFELAFNRRLAELGSVTFCRIEIAPFEVSRFGIRFGLIPRPPENEGDAWWAEMSPGNYLAFTEPWDGDYST